MGCSGRWIEPASLDGMISYRFGCLPGIAFPSRVLCILRCSEHCDVIRALAKSCARLRFFESGLPLLMRHCWISNEGIGR